MSASVWEARLDGSVLLPDKLDLVIADQTGQRLLVTVDVDKLATSLAKVAAGRKSKTVRRIRGGIAAKLYTPRELVLRQTEDGEWWAVDNCEGSAHLLEATSEAGAVKEVAELYPGRKVVQ